MFTSYCINICTGAYLCRSEGFPARDICFLHTVPQGSYQMGRVVGTPSPPPPSVGVTGGLSPPGAPTLLIEQGRNPGPNGLSVPSSWSKWAGSPQVPILQYFQIHKSYQNAWSFSIFRFRGPQNAWSSDAQSINSDTQHKRYKFRHPKHKFRHPKYSGISSDTKSTAV